MSKASKCRMQDGREKSCLCPISETRAAQNSLGSSGVRKQGSGDLGRAASRIK